MERATVAACSCWPARASAPATAASARACQSGSVMERATVCGLLVLAGLGQRPGHRRQRLRLPVRVGDGAGEGFGADVLAERGPHGGQTGGDVGVAVGEVVAVAGQSEGGGEVGVVLGGDQVEGDGDLVQGGGIPAGDVEHPLVPGGVGGAGHQPGGVAGGGQHLEVAAQQVFRGTGGPAPIPVLLRPGVQAVLVAGQPLIAEVCRGGGLEFLMAQQVHLGADLGLPRAHPAGEGAPGHPVQDVLDLPEGFAGQGGQVGAAEPAPGGGEQPEQILLGGRAVQQAPQFLLRQRLDVLGIGGGGQRADDAGVTQPVPAGYVVRDRGVGPPGDHDPHPGRRVMRQQRGDAVRVRPGGDATVLIQPVHHQDQPLTPRGAGLGGLLQHPEQVGVPGGSRQTAAGLVPAARPAAPARPR